MRIKLLSDTHVRYLKDLHDEIVDELTGVDPIIHARDYKGKRFLDGLKS